MTAKRERKAFSDMSLIELAQLRTENGCPLDTHIPLLTAFDSKGDMIIDGKMVVVWCKDGVLVNTHLTANSLGEAKFRYVNLQNASSFFIMYHRKAP